MNGNGGFHDWKMCAECSKKIGAFTLCDACYHNQNLFFRMAKRSEDLVEEADETKKTLQDVLSGFTRFVEQQTN